MSSDAQERVDLITGNPEKAIRHLSWPVMVSMFLMMSYNMADIIWVAGLGTDAMAALGFVSPLFAIIVGIGGGVGAGATSLIARCIGAQDKIRANNAALHSMGLTILVCIFLSILSALVLKDVAILMGAADVLDLTLEYGYIVFICSFAIIIPAVGAAILRAEGDMKRATIAIAITAIINIIIDPIFIYVLNWGLRGAAWATVLSSLIAGAVIFYWILIKKDTYLSLKYEDFKYDVSIIKDILLVAIPASLEELLMSSVGIIINFMLVIVGGTVAVAVFTAGWRLIALGIVPVLGIGVAGITVAGAAYGARDYEKIKRTYIYSLKLGLITSIPLTILACVFAPQIALAFSYSDVSSSLAPLITNAIPVLSLVFIAIPFGFIPACFFQAFGKGIHSLVLTILREVVLIVIFAYILGFTLSFGEVGIWWGVIIGDFAGAFVGILVLNKFLKKLKKEFAT